MSEINEEFLIEDNVDFDDIELADEEALLQDEDEVLNLNETPDDETLTDAVSVDAKAQTDNDEERGSRKDKFATERQRITAPESSDNEKPNIKNCLKTRGFNNNRSRGRGRGRGGRYPLNNNQSRNYPFNQGMQYNQGTQPGRNKTVLINPRFQGVVHVNNNARLAWDDQSQNYPSNIWLPNPQISQNAPVPPQSPMQGFQPQSLQYQSPPPPFTGPSPFMNQGPPINQGLMNQPPTYFNQGPGMNHPPAMQNMGFPPPQNNVMQSGFGQPNFMSPPPVNQGYGAPNFPPSGHPPAAHPYWERMNPVGFPQCPPSQGHNTYIHFESPPPQSMNMPPPQYNPQPTFERPVQSNTQPFERKMAPVEQFPRKKRLIHERLGTVDSNVKVRKFMVADGDRQTNRIVKELSITKVKFEEDSETRDLRLKIEEQKRKREEILKWKEARRLESLKVNSGQAELNYQQPKPFQAVQRLNIVQVKNRINQQHQNRSYQQTGGRTPVLLQVKQVEEQRQNVVKLTQESTASEIDVELNQKHLNNFLAGRKVLVKDETLPTTRRVMIKNLSTNTGDKKLFQICKSIGEVQVRPRLDGF